METNEVDNFLGETKDGVKEVKIQDDPFKQEADPFDMKIEAKETKAEDKEEVEEKPLPFHKDPKVQRFIEKEIAKRIGEIKPEDKTTEEIKDEADELLIRIIGNDTPEKVAAVKDFKKYLQGLEEKGAERAISRLQEQEIAARREEEQALETLNSGFENIEQNYNVDLSSNSPVAKKTRSEFIDFIRRVSPKDEDGEITSFPDLNETFALFQEIGKNKVPSNARAKQLSSRSMDRSVEASGAPQSDDKSWKAVDRIFGKL